MALVCKPVGFALNFYRHVVESDRLHDKVDVGQPISH